MPEAMPLGTEMPPPSCMLTLAPQTGDTALLLLLALAAALVALLFNHRR